MNATRTKSETVGDFEIRYEPDGQGDPTPWTISEKGDDGCIDTACTRRGAIARARQEMAERLQERVIDRIGRVKDLDRLNAILALIG